MWYDAFFVPPHCPQIGDREQDCLAAVAIKNAGGNVVQWHCQLSEIQFKYHSTRNGKDISKAVGATKRLSWSDPVLGAQTKDCPMHVFAGSGGVYDVGLKKLLVADKKPDLDVSSASVAVGANNEAVLESER
jgi:hypothetical protein